MSSWQDIKRMNSRAPRQASNGSPEPVFRCFLLKNLNRKTIAATIRDVFIKYGELEQVQLNLNENETPNGTAIVLFKSRPLTTQFLQAPVSIDGRLVAVEPRANPDKALRDHTSSSNSNSSRRRSRMNGKYFAMGVFKDDKTFVEEWATRFGVSITINYDKRNIQVFFAQSGEQYRLELHLKDLATGDIKLERDDDVGIFTLISKHPARFWRDNKKASKESKTVIKYSGQWERITSLPSDTDRSPGGSRQPVMPMGEVGKPRLGVCVVYRIEFALTSRNRAAFDHLLVEAGEFNLVPRNGKRTKPYIHTVKAGDLRPPKNHVDRANLLDARKFDLLYVLESLILSHVVNEHNLDDDFYETVAKLPEAVAISFLNTLYMNKVRLSDPLTAIRQIYEEKGIQSIDDKRLPDHCAKVRKIIVTPTSLYLVPSQVETTNRVIRHFSDHADRFARVQFADEGHGRISASHTGRNNDALYDRIFQVLMNGIQIGKRRYDFLAFSSSQLRDQACWFFAPTPELNANHIRQWMGTFSHERIIAKHAVRMGQCFSSTRSITRLEGSEMEQIDDIERNGYTFSDGVGKISAKLAKEIAIKMELRTVPCAFQFRFGGAKGVLSVSNFLEGRKIQLRPSQIKFSSTHYELEIIRFSTLIPGYLNRQAITILSALGISDEIFMDKMDRMIALMNNILKNPDDAHRALMSNLDEFGTARMMARIIKAGFLTRRDPYIINLLNMFRVAMLKDLKKKAKIHIPKGAFLLGVIDETNTLQEGEVFCQISVEKNDGARRHIITGEAVVFRNPCFHPGDVRKVQAVDRPELHHLHDVLVFSSQGFRDLPSMLSGGDLDGDDYTIFWDKDLIFSRPNHDAMEYKAEEPTKVDKVQIYHVKKFFVNYINNDNLGQIANAHLATADRSPQGALDGACLRLAQLHSCAVDFPKSGKPAKFDDDLRVRAFPDFMQKKDKEMYESKKVLGRIYRAVDKADYKSYKSHLVDNTEFDPRLRITGMERYIYRARKLRAEYNRDLMALMNQFGVGTEAEIMSGYIVKWLKKGNRKSMHEVQKQTMSAVANMRETWRRELEREFLKDPSSTTSVRAIEAKAAAWYYVTYHPVERQHFAGDGANLLSFPWVAEDLITRIAIRNAHRPVTEEQLVPFDEETIEKYGKLQFEDMQVSIIDDSSDEEYEEEDEGEIDLLESEAPDYEDHDGEEGEDDDGPEVYTQVYTQRELRGFKPFKSDIHRFPPSPSPSNSPSSQLSPKNDASASKSSGLAPPENNTNHRTVAVSADAGEEDLMDILL
ncbi:RNA dependent RNA polymerase-domain-containing protein [Syncephalastrum racemosum]|uniref:RNA-dependent RNA polymerase n=1 Tax=Syncephalastrum racemosum TaxID=13706 RepID=A0A1X2H303_SYNRA|nr:RNA dependent RNA polymerase-domain-containing protein [Syncephalastrum racemosum]